LQQQPYLRESRAFPDTETNLALNAIREILPPVVAIERNFAATLPGQAFIRRIKTDLTLKRCEIEIIGLRRSARHKLTRVVEISIDENPAEVLDISMTGAHVVSAWSLKPKQRIRVVLRAGERPLTALVVWAHFELPNEGPRYRAGIEFVSTAADIVSEFMSTLEVQ
jgi:hypothetical protein